ncbi:MAG: hypothetical protein WC753_04795 [Candidatus Gracilibacteria bacterium]|jgi:hypothetical protein
MFSAAMGAAGGTTPLNPNKFGKAMGWGMLGGGLGSLFGGGDNPYDAGKSYYNKIPDTIKPYFDPYISAGKDAMGQVQGQYGNLINDPNAMYNKLGSGYQQSPGYQWQVGQGMNAVNNAAAAGGMLGTPQHQQNAAQMTQGIANQDFNNYLGHMLGLYGSGLSGMSGINQMGYNASTGLAGLLGSNLMNQGNMAISSQAAQNQSQGSQFGNIIGGLGTLAAFM